MGRLGLLLHREPPPHHHGASRRGALLLRSPSHPDHPDTHGPRHRPRCAGRCRDRCPRRWSRSPPRCRPGRNDGSAGWLHRGDGRDQLCPELLGQDPRIPGQERRRSQESRVDHQSILHSRGDGLGQVLCHPLCCPGRRLRQLRRRDRWPSLPTAREVDHGQGHPRCR